MFFSSLDKSLLGSLSSCKIVLFCGSCYPGLFLLVFSHSVVLFLCTKAFALFLLISYSLVSCSRLLGPFIYLVLATFFGSYWSFIYLDLGIFTDLVVFNYISVYCICLVAFYYSFIYPVFPCLANCK